MRLFAETHYTAKCRPLPSLSDHEISYFAQRLDITGGDVQRRAINSLKPWLLCPFLTIRVDIYATGGSTLFADKVDQIGWSTRSSLFISVNIS
jgi:hypothetical protein